MYDSQLYLTKPNWISRLIMNHHHNHFLMPSTYSEENEDLNNSKYEMKEYMFKLLVVGDYGVGMYMFNFFINRMYFLCIFFDPINTLYEFFCKSISYINSAFEWHDVHLYVQIVSIITPWRLVWMLRSWPFCANFCWFRTFWD